MTKPKGTATGRCLCGGVKYEVDGPLRDVLNCHCDRCRRTTGHFMAATSTTRDAMTITDQGSLRWYDVDGAVYGFCSTCGSSLFWKPDGDPTEISICAGTLDGPTGLTTAAALYTADALDYHNLDQSIENLEYE